MKLLILDDQEPVGQIICRIAQQGGWHATQTTSAKNIVQLIREEKFHVLLIDYLLDGTDAASLNGLAVVKELRDAGIQIPVIVLTGWPDMVDRALARELHILRILEKPLSIQELRLALVEAKKQALNEPPQDPA